MVLSKIVPVVLIATVLGLAGCANAATTPGFDDSAEARQVLERSLSGLQAGNYTFIRSDGVQGSVDLPGGSQIVQPDAPSVLRSGSALYLRYRLHGSQYDTWAKIYDGPATGANAEEVAKAKQVMAVLDGRHWVRADEKRLRAAAADDDQSGLDVMPPVPTADRPDVTGATDLVAAVVSARRSGDTVTGTLDATAVDPERNVLGNDPYYVHGPRAKEMPYRAMLDADGRLSELTVDVPGELAAPASQPPAGIAPDAPAGAGRRVVISISEYGRTAELNVPAGATDLDPVAYEMLTNDID